MSRSKTPLEIAIVGGAIGGLFAALSLHHHCGSQVSISVYEQTRQYRDIGTGVGIGLNAAKLFDKLGLYDDAAKISGWRKHVWMSFRRYDNGREIFTVPAKEEGKIKQLSVVRAELLQLMLGWVKQREVLKLQTGKKCVELREAGNKVMMGFSDGTSAMADLVVGADGIHSFIRSQFVADHAKYSGTVAYRCLCPVSKVSSWWSLPSYGAEWLSPNRHFLTFPVSQTDTGENRLLNVVAVVATPAERLSSTDRESWTQVAEKDEILKEFEGFDEMVRHVIENIEPEPAKSLLYDRNPIENWVLAGGKVVLLGDAAHAMLPHSGQGAGQAIEDGYVLGLALRDYFFSTTGQSLEMWLQMYQEVRSPRAASIQGTSRELGKVYEMRTKEMQGLSYDECLPVVMDQVKERMNWIWLEDVDASYEKVRARLMGQ